MVDLIGMILHNAPHGTFEGVIVDDDGKELSAARSLDYMIMEYAKVKNGGSSTTVTVRKLD